MDDECEAGVVDADAWARPCCLVTPPFLRWLRPGSMELIRDDADRIADHLHIRCPPPGRVVLRFSPR